jgi:hypothetical protein
MIVRRTETTLVLVAQLDHSALSGEFARHWGAGSFRAPEPRDSVILAAARHDEGWRDQDVQPLYDAVGQAPSHFRTLNVRMHIPFYRGGIERIVALDPYAGLLVSMHGSGIYQGRYGAGPIRMSTQTDDVRALMEAFVAEQEAVQASLKRQLWSGSGRRRLFERAVWAHYELLQVWDLLSLFICLDRHGPSGMQDIGPAPTAPDGDDVMLHMEAAGEDTVRIAPWPFDRPVIDAAVPARAIPARPYESQRALRDALEVSADATVHCRIVPG